MSELRATAATFSRGTNYKLTFIVLGLVDLVLTLYALSNGYYERNPVFESLQHNPMGLFMLKLAGPVAIAWLVPARLLLPSIALLFAVVGWNLAELLTR
ncbi:MAG: DUF5658 family protein [Chloroflexi bacterium]|nr:DUF5658 family protein [Chloroflexota bacterium]